MPSHVEVLDRSSVCNTEKNMIVHIGNESFVCEKDLDDVANCIVVQFNKNNKHNVCIGEFTNQVRIPNFSLEEMAIVYAKVYIQVNGDKVIRHADGYAIELWENEQ